jgi:hypothetical protein
VPTIAVQYLEPGPHLATLTPGEVRLKLHIAFSQLPISAVLLGWHLPPTLLDACREEIRQAGAKLYRWHPLLTGDGAFVPRPEWRTIGLQGEPVPGFKNMPEFTFVCPNRPAVQEAVLGHLHQVIKDGTYEGLFLDRIRYPSPAADPARWLACFCEDCRRVAADRDLDLEAIRRSIKRLLAGSGQIESFIQILLDPAISEPAQPELASLQAYLNFRTWSLAHFIRAIADMIHMAGLTVGLDCFSPALTHMVGQDLAAIAACGEWTKVMTYGHTLGPAGLPFELLGLANWLVGQQRVPESQALAWLSRAMQLPLPATRSALKQEGLLPETLQAEIKRGRQTGIKRLLAGIELVEIEGVAQLKPPQIEADLRALQMAGADGLVLSWDLWEIPRERLQLVRKVWVD